jgi:transcriptional regulator with XRE-family HTH domain
MNLLMKKLSEKNTLIILGKQLKELREQHKLTQSQVAEELGISQQWYQRLEIGKADDIKLSHLIRICHLYSISLVDLFSNELFTNRQLIARKNNEINKLHRQMIKLLEKKDSTI